MAVRTWTASFCLLCVVWEHVVLSTRISVTSASPRISQEGGYARWEHKGWETTGRKLGKKSLNNPGHFLRVTCQTDFLKRNSLDVGTEHWFMNERWGADFFKNKSIWKGLLFYKIRCVMRVSPSVPRYYCIDIQPADIYTIKTKNLSLKHKKNSIKSNAMVL